MSRLILLLSAVVLSLLVIAFAACGGDEEEEGTETGTTPTQAGDSAPTGTAVSGSATATVRIGDRTFTFEDGKCEVGPDEAWLALTIGQAGAGDYFGLLVGANPEAPESAQPVAGGGVFSFDDGEVALSGEKDGVPFVMSGAGSTVTVASDLASGEFDGSAFDGQPISGSFRCS